MNTFSYELPREAVSEAIVNAVAHRDYSSNASVQLMLFSNRLEVWNPGRLPPGLTPEKFTRAHASIPHNPLLARPLSRNAKVMRVCCAIVACLLRGCSYSSKGIRRRFLMRKFY